MSPELRFKCADEFERMEAVRLRDSIYKEETGHIPSDDLDDRAIHLVALATGGTIVATSRLVGPECRPFDFERYVDLSSVVNPQARIGLVGRFCVAHEFRRVPQSLWLHLGMLKLMYLVAKQERLVRLVMYTFDHLLMFYRGAYFEPIDGMQFFHGGYGRQMHLMQFDIAQFEADHLCEGGRFAELFASIDAVA